MTTLDPSRTASLFTARQVLYRYLSAAFFDPRSGSWFMLARPQTQQGVRAAAELIRDESCRVGCAHQAQMSDADKRLAQPILQLGLGERPLSQLDPAEMLERLPPTEDAANTEFERTFGLVVSGVCPPYETEYLNSKFTFQRSQHMADVAGFYQAFGLNLSRVSPDRPDHISLELEFMACLIGLERQADAECQADTLVSETEQNDRVEICREAQRRFLREHLVWWVPTFSRLLERENPKSVYAAAGRLLCAFLPTERALLGVEPASGNVAPTSIESPVECAGCPIA